MKDYMYIKANDRKCYIREFIHTLHILEHKL